MKIVKQMLMHISTLYEKSDIRHAYSDSFTIHLESKFVSAASKMLAVLKKYVSDKTSSTWYL